MARPTNTNDTTVNGVFNLNSLLEDLPQSASASAPSTPFPDAISKGQIGRAHHAHHSSLSANAFPAFQSTTASSQSPAIGGSPSVSSRNTSVFDYGGPGGQSEHRSAYRMPRTINVSVFNGQLRRGHCKFFNSQKGFGFINDAKPEDLDHVEVFVHFTAIASTGGFRSLAENEECEYTLVPGPKGYQASNVTGPGGRPVVGDPKARAPISPKPHPPYMFMPPHGPHFYDPYHAHHPSAGPYYAHSPYQQVMLSIVPTNGSPYAQVAHPGYGGANGSPYGMHAGPGTSLPPSPPATANGHQYMYSPAPGGGTPGTRSSPFASASPYGLGLGALGNGAMAKTPWQPPSSVSGLGGHRVSSAEASGRFGSPAIGHSSGPEASPIITATATGGDYYANGGGPGANGAAGKKHPSTTPTVQGAFDAPAHGRRGSSAQELFEGTASKPSSSSGKAPQRTSGSAASGLLYPSATAAAPKTEAPFS